MASKRSTTPDETEFKRCECDCGQIVNPKRRFAPGHDQRHKGNLLRLFDAGQGSAGQELVDRGWRTEEELAERRAKLDSKAEAKAAKAKPDPEPVEKVAKPRRRRAATEQAAVTA